MDRTSNLALAMSSLRSASRALNDEITAVWGPSLPRTIPKVRTGGKNLEAKVEALNNALRADPVDPDVVSARRRDLVAAKDELLASIDQLDKRDTGPSDQQLDLMRQEVDDLAGRLAAWVDRPTR